MSEAFSFDATTVEPSKALDVIPAGWYRAYITESELKATQKGGKYLELVWSILDGEQKGRKVWDRLNVKNDNPTAQEIALRDLSAICHATGVLKMRFPDELHHKPVLIKVVVKPAKGEYSEGNEIKGYREIDGAGNGAPTRQVSRVASAAVAEDNEDDSDLPF